MRTIALLSATLALASFVVPVHAQTARWGSPTEATVKAMIAMEKMWLDAECGPQPALKDVFADEFQGTAPDGRRYGKAKAVESGRNARDCQLGEVKVQFFGDVMAVAYGSESTLRTGKDGKEEKFCLTWTDTWLKRGSRWQIVAAQDTIVSCK